MFLTYTFFNVIILHFTNVQHVLDRVLIEKSRKSYLCLTTKLHVSNVQHVLDHAQIIDEMLQICILHHSYTELHMPEE